MANTSTTSLRDAYAARAISQVPRLLSLQDRNQFSPTYGSFDRTYWLDKTEDFPNALPQFGVLTLALVYRHEFAGSIYRGQPKIRDWAIAGMDYWASLQHKDGSFDEFYPYERGWAGPSAFTTYANLEAYRLLKDEMPQEVAQRVLGAARKAARFIAKGESEQDLLANHHAVASLAVWKAYEILGDADLKAGFQGLLQGFLKLHNAEEGWSREYDGVDPGYLSATVSFLSKIYQTNPDPKILEVLRQSVEFCSYFAYPNGFYGGSMGSRNTMHFYPHGFEIMAGQVPMAASVAEHMLKALSEGKLVPPEIMADRYLFYRVPELLQAYLDYSARPAALPLLPYQREPGTRYFPAARVYTATLPGHYVVANLAKGGVVKVFDKATGRLILNDCGVIGKLDNGKVVTTQWVDPTYECQTDDTGWQVSGHLNIVPSNKLFSPLKMIIFRAVLIALGWSPRLSHFMKGSIRKSLMLGNRPAPVAFRRSFRFDGDGVTLEDEIRLEGNVKFQSLSIGDEFFVRYVPQSRYFQSQELEVKGTPFDSGQLAKLNRERHITIGQRVALAGLPTASTHAPRLHS
ncbi:MAG: hypothetical protein Q7K03_07025 [Dehalococcoidia bacterium]|nr:hypothetical protein [Dehalococcoidia bacterium]